jgi:hypothetical protein
MARSASRSTSPAFGSLRGGRLSSRRPGRRAAAAALAACLLQGCATGHLIDAARIDERVAHIHRAWTDGERLYVRYTASLTSEGGRPLGEVERTAAIDLDALRAAARAPANALPVRWLADGSGASDGWRALPMRRSGAGDDGYGDGDGHAGAPSRDGDGRDGHGSHAAHAAVVGATPAVAGPPPALAVYVADGGGAPVAFALADGLAPAEIPVGALSRGHTASWVWPLLPLTVAFDVFTTPVMVFFAFPLVALGD